ncbi:hypothetical protein CPC08DRAFT_97740 [Agrocybe pediades]|nr:hypothetical protein CPC08DRAFT_97740 [Agrocybe pediades]
MQEAYMSFPEPTVGYRASSDVASISDTSSLPDYDDVRPSEDLHMPTQLIFPQPGTASERSTTNDGTLNNLGLELSMTPAGEIVKALTTCFDELLAISKNPFDPRSTFETAARAAQTDMRKAIEMLVDMHRAGKPIQGDIMQPFQMLLTDITQVVSDQKECMDDSTGVLNSEQESSRRMTAQQLRLIMASFNRAFHMELHYLEKMELLESQFSKAKVGNDGKVSLDAERKERERATGSKEEEQRALEEERKRVESDRLYALRLQVEECREEKEEREAEALRKKQKAERSADRARQKARKARRDAEAAAEQARKDAERLAQSFQATQWHTSHAHAAYTPYHPSHSLNVGGMLISPGRIHIPGVLDLRSPAAGDSTVTGPLRDGLFTGGGGRVGLAYARNGGSNSTNAIHTVISNSFNNNTTFYG